MVDTGFTGHLTLLSAMVEALGLPNIGSAESILTDGSMVMEDVCTARVLWHGEERPVRVLVSDAPPGHGAAAWQRTARRMPGWRRGLDREARGAGRLGTLGDDPPSFLSRELSQGARTVRANYLQATKLPAVHVREDVYFPSEGRGSICERFARYCLTDLATKALHIAVPPPDEKLTAVRGSWRIADLADVSIFSG